VVLFLYPNLKERKKNVNEKMFQSTARWKISPLKMNGRKEKIIV